MPVKKVLVDGRVFSTTAHDRGMGRYVIHILSLLFDAGHDVTLLLFRNCRLTQQNPLLSKYAIRFANYDPEAGYADPLVRSHECHKFTAFLSALIEADSYAVYVDATPFIGPIRLDLFGCAVIAVCYDFIPLKHPDFYLGSNTVRPIYYNGLARLVKSDMVITISQTVHDEALRYLAIRPERQVVIHPTLEDWYLNVPKTRDREAPTKDHLFSIVGFHKSKNPHRALEICRQLLKLRRYRILINAPTPDQMEHIKAQLAVPGDIKVTSSISEEDKFALQSEAAVIAHFSLEEGFGIPLLEAFFLGRKVLAMDTAINREFFSKSKVAPDSAVFLLPPEGVDIDLAAFARFLETPTEDAFFTDIRESYIDHWAHSGELIERALAAACDNHVAWNAQLQAKIFSSIPGTSCGVADYSVAYVRSAPGNILFFFSEGEPENISYLTNIKALTYLDFDRVARSMLGSIPVLFNFAFSPALDPGIELLRKFGTQSDIVLVHERRYIDGLLTMKRYTDRVDELLVDFTATDSAEEKSRQATTMTFHPWFNTHVAGPPVPAYLASGWLNQLPVRFISHLPPEVIHQMDALEALNPGTVVNDLADLENRFEFVPLGIDDRSHPSILRSAARLRAARGIQQDDLVIGHFGLILNDLKRLWDVAQAFVAFAAEFASVPGQQRRLYFSLVGKIVHNDLFLDIQKLFAAVGLSGRLIHSNPPQEQDFDAEIAACDAIFCFRVQNRGQLSHVFVRSLSLGTPAIVNELSGYGFDARTIIDDADIVGGTRRVLQFLLNKSTALEIRKCARAQYQAIHRADQSLTAILGSGRQ